MLDFLLLKEAGQLLTEIMLPYSLNFLLRFLDNSFVSDFFVTILDSSDKYFQFNNFMQNHIYLKLVELDFFETMCIRVLGNVKKPLRPTNKVQRNLNLDNFQEALMGAESKYANVFHASVDCTNFNFEISPEISRYDVDFLADIVQEKD